MGKKGAIVRSMKRFRISLRLLLLIVALCAVCFATVGAWVNMGRSKRSMQLLGIESRLELLQLQHKSESKELSDPQKREAAGTRL